MACLGAGPLTETDSDDTDLPAMPHAPPEAPSEEDGEVIDMPVLRQGDAPVLPEPRPAQGERPSRGQGQQGSNPSTNGY